MTACYQVPPPVTIHPWGNQGGITVTYDGSANGAALLQSIQDYQKTVREKSPDWFVTFEYDPVQATYRVHVLPVSALPLHVLGRQRRYGVR